MINIYFQIAGIINIMLILVLFTLQKKIMLKSSRLFIFQIVGILLSLMLDIFSLVCIRCNNIFSFWFTKFICKLYLISIIFVAFEGYLYVLYDVFKKNERKYYKRVIVSLVILFIACLVILLLPIKIIRGSDGLRDYTAGIIIHITYMFSFIFILLTLFYTITKRNSMNKKRSMAVNIWMILWVVGAMIQFITNYILKTNITLLVIGFVETLGTFIIYVTLENPIYYLDRETQEFNLGAYKEYISELFNRKHDFSALIVYPEINGTNDAYNDALNISDIEKVISNLKDGIIFKAEDRYGIIFKGHDKHMEYIEALNKLSLKKPKYMFRYVYLDNPRLLKDYYEYSKAVFRMYNNAKNKNLEFVEINEQNINVIKEKLNNEEILDYALKNDGIRVFYQPIYSLKDKKYKSAEALVRIEYRGEIIPPSKFIDICESNGSIIELGRKVFINVCKFIQNHNMEELGLEYIEVNLSPAQLNSNGFAERFIEFMKEYKVNPKYINFEVTERESVNSKTLFYNMEKLIQYGCSFSLDDFGTGNSNLNYIVDMPVSIVKFDRELVNSYFRDQNAKYIMTSAIKMIQGLNLKVVLEGIDNEIGVNEAYRLGIDFIQGYYYSKPINEETFVKFLIDNKVS